MYVNCHRETAEMTKKKLLSPQRDKSHKLLRYHSSCCQRTATQPQQPGGYLSMSDTITDVCRFNLHKPHCSSVKLLKGDFPENPTALSHHPRALCWSRSQYSSLSTHFIHRICNFIYHKPFFFICQQLFFIQVLYRYCIILLKFLHN